MFRRITLAALLVALIGTGIWLLPARQLQAGRPGPPVPAAKSPARDDLVIVVNKVNPIDNLSFAELRKLFLGERSHWPDGHKITVVMRERGAPERQMVLHRVYQMSESDYNQYFTQAVFSGRLLSAPKLLATSDGVRRFIFNVPGAIGYVRLDELDDSVKPLRVDGHAPGEDGYELKPVAR